MELLARVIRLPVASPYLVCDLSAVKPLFLTAVFCCFLLPLPAQVGRIEYFTVTDGLSTREINDLHIGDDGYLWIATMDGINRFDGHGFLSFGQGPLSDARLSRGGIESIRSDNDRRLIITFNEFYGYFDRFDPRDFSVEQVRMVPSTGVAGYPRAIETDQYGRTFVVTIGQEGTTLYEYTDSGFQVIFNQPDDGWLTFAPRIELLPLDNGQFLLYDEEHGFRHLSAAGVVLDEFFPRTSGQRRFYTMAQAPDGLVYLSFRDGYPLFRWRPGATRDPVPVPGLDAGLRYTKIFKDKLGQLLFMATEDILGRRYPDEYYLVDTAGALTLFERELPVNRLVTTAAAKNFNETTYLGLREGLGVMERYVKSIQSYLTSSGTRDLYRRRVTGITEDADGTVYVAEADGQLHAMARGGSELTRIPLRSAEGEEIVLREMGQLIYDRIRNAVWGVAQPIGLSKGGVLFATTWPSKPYEPTPPNIPSPAWRWDRRATSTSVPPTRVRWDCFWSSSRPAWSSSSCAPSRRATRTFGGCASITFCHPVTGNCCWAPATGVWWPLTPSPARPPFTAASRPAINPRR